MASLSGPPLRQFELVKTLPEVPESHAFSGLYRHPLGVAAVPIVDLASPDAVRLIGLACEEWGTFQLTGHGLPVGLIDRLEAQTRRLFSLPADQKLRAYRGPGDETGYGHATVSAFHSKIFWSEGFTILDSPRDDARKIWPDEDCSEFCGTMEEYMRLLKDLCRRLVQSMLLALGLSEEDVDQAAPLKGYDEVTPVLQLNWYPPCPDPDRAMGIAEHTDSSLITVLYQSSDRVGLQLLHAGKDGEARWVAVPPLPGAIIVNVGDLFQILSNGRFRSVMHRAVVNRAGTRFSVAYFCGAPAEIKVAPMEKLIGPDQGPAYRAVTWPEFLALKKKLYNQTMASLALPKKNASKAT